MALVPGTVIPSLAATIAGVYVSGIGNNIGGLVAIGGFIATYYSLNYASDTLKDYNNKIVTTSPDGPDDWEFEDPSLKDQLREAKDNLILLQAELVQEERKNRRGR